MSYAVITHVNNATVDAAYAALPNLFGVVYAGNAEAVTLSGGKHVIYLYGTYAQVSTLYKARTAGWFLLTAGDIAELDIPGVGCGPFCEGYKDGAAGGGGGGPSLDMYNHPIDDASVVLWDPTSMINTSSQVGEVTNVTLNALTGGAGLGLATSAAWLIPLKDINGTRINGADVCGLVGKIEVTAAPAITDKVAISVGWCDGTVLTVGTQQQCSGGLYWVDAVGPKAIGFSRNYVGSDGMSTAGGVHGGCNLTKTLKYNAGHGTLYDSSWNAIGASIRQGAETWSANDLYRFVAIHRLSTANTTPTISFKTYFAPAIMLRDGVAPPTTG